MKQREMASVHIWRWPQKHRLTHFPLFVRARFGSPILSFLLNIKFELWAYKFFMAICLRTPLLYWRYYLRQVELSSAKLSSLSWGWVELWLSWVEAELELNLSWDWACQIFEVFNWSIRSLQLKYLKLTLKSHFTTILDGWVGVWLYSDYNASLSSNWT